jgi:hypothetical protein
MVAPGGVVRPEVLANKRLKLSSSRGGSIRAVQAPEAIEESMMLMKSELRARSLSADR